MAFRTLDDRLTERREPWIDSDTPVAKGERPGVPPLSALALASRGAEVPYFGIRSTRALGISSRHVLIFEDAPARFRANN